MSITIRDVEYGGRTQWHHQHESDNAHSAQHPLNRAVVWLAGITAEGELLGTESMGAGNDVDAATGSIMGWIRWGVSPEFGRLGIDQLERHDRGPAVLDEYNAIIRLKVEECQRQATRFVRKYSSEIMCMAHLLFEAEDGQLAGDQLQEALSAALASGDDQNVRPDALG